MAVKTTPEQRDKLRAHATQHLPRERATFTCQAILDLCDDADLLAGTGGTEAVPVAATAEAWKVLEDYAESRIYGAAAREFLATHPAPSSLFGGGSNRLDMARAVGRDEGNDRRPVAGRLPDQ